MPSHLNFTKKQAKAHFPSISSLVTKQTQVKTLAKKRLRTKEQPTNPKTQIISKKKMSKKQKKLIISHLWAKRKVLLLKMNKNSIFSDNSSECFRLGSALNQKEQPNLIINDQKEPLLRSFENHQANWFKRARDNNFNRIQNKVVNQCSLDHRTISVESQSTQADAMDSQITSSSSQSRRMSEEDYKENNENMVQKIEIGTPQREGDRESSFLQIDEFNGEDFMYRRRIGQLNRDSEEQDLSREDGYSLGQQDEYSLRFSSEQQLDESDSSTILLGGLEINNDHIDHENNNTETNNSSNTGGMMLRITRCSGKKKPRNSEEEQDL